MSDDAARPLTDHELRYLEHLRLYLRDMSRRDWRALLAAAEQNLAERRATADFEELLQALQITMPPR